MPPVGHAGLAAAVVTRVPRPGSLAACAHMGNAWALAAGVSARIRPGLLCARTQTYLVRLVVARVLRGRPMRPLIHLVAVVRSGGSGPPAPAPPTASAAPAKPSAGTPPPPAPAGTPVTGKRGPIGLRVRRGRRATAPVWRVPPRSQDARSLQPVRPVHRLDCWSDRSLSRSHIHSAIHPSL